MLISFSVGNFKVFKEKVTLDMRGASISKSSDAHIIDAGKYKLLKSVAIYGPNASGKSKLLEAIEFMRDFVINSSKNTQANEEIPTDPFRLSTETRDQPSHFEIEFLMEEKTYRYGFEVNIEKVTKEWLFYRPNNLTEKPLFARIEDEFEITPKFKEGKGIEKRTRKNTLFLSAVAQWNGEIAAKMVTWFERITFFDSTWDSDDDTATMELLENEKYKTIFSEVLKIADLDIDGIEKHVYQEVIEKKSGLKRALPNTFEHLFTLHKVYDEKGAEVESAYFEMDEHESVGTRKFFNLIGIVLQAIENGHILISDEINANFHPKLMQALVTLFSSNVVNKNKSQFIFTTHDTNLIDTEFLSRDQIYFIEKNKYGAARLYSLIEFKTRKEDNHEREYFEGKYGAIPFIKNLEKAFEKLDNGKTETKAA